MLVYIVAESRRQHELWVWSEERWAEQQRLKREQEERERLQKIEQQRVKREQEERERLQKIEIEVNIYVSVCRGGGAKSTT